MIRAFSSFASDVITYQDNRIVSGGPALWIQKCLQDLGVEYIMHAPKNPGLVQIDKDGNGEDKGTILSIGEIGFVKPNTEDIILISTLKQEFDLEHISDLTNTVCIDIQGFLRGENGKRHRLDCRSIRSGGEVFIKSTRQEFSYLDHHEDTKHIFIITNGGDDIEILGNGIDKSITIPSGKFDDTIGAGDTFFAGFSLYYMISKDIEDAVTKASIYTYEFLTKKNK